MSNSTTGRFKSKALSYVVTQTRRWIDECEKAVRHAKVAVKWGAQMALYPVYALFQASRMVGRQLQGAVHHTLKQLPFGAAQSSPEADTPIQTVVHLLEQLVVAVPAIAPTEIAAPPDLSHLQVFVPTAEQFNPFSPPEKKSLWRRFHHGLTVVRQSIFGPQQANSESAIVAPSSSALRLRKLGSLTASQQPEMNPAPVKIQGVASLLDSRHLVLVMPGNQILDILTLTQQHQLQQRIIWEIANYWYRHKRQATSTRSLRASRPALGDRSRSALTLPEAFRPEQLRGLPERLSLLPARLRALPEHLHEQTKDVKVGQLLQPVWTLLRHIPQALSQLNVLPSTDPTDLPRLPGQHPNSAFGLMLDFGLFRFLAERSQVQQLWDLNQPSWLTLHDLGGTDKPESKLDSSVALAADVVDATLSAPTSQPWHRRFFPSLKQFFWQLLQPLRSIWPLISRRQTLIPGASPVQKRVPASHASLVPLTRPSLRQVLGTIDGSLSSSRTTSGTSRGQGMAGTAVPIVLAQTPEGYTIEFNPNWIEVEATAVGYVKHPLERILEWIDQIFYWIETVAVLLWNGLLYLLRSAHKV